MSDEECSSEEESCLDQSQQQRRTYNMSSSLAEGDEVSYTDDIDKEDQDDSPKEAVVKVSKFWHHIGCRDFNLDAIQI